MKTKSKIIAIIWALTAGLGLVPKAQAARPSIVPAPLAYHVMSFPAHFTPTTVNDNKIFFGICQGATQGVPCYYDARSRQTFNAPVASGGVIFSYAMNNAGTVAGSGTPVFGGPLHAAFLSASGIHPIAFGATPTATDTLRVNAINDSDVMIGWLSDSTGYQGPFVYHPSLPFAFPISQVLSLPISQQQTFLRSINNSFHVVGHGLVGTSNLPFYADLLTNTLSPLDISGFNLGSAFDVNDRDEIVGGVYMGASLPQPVIWNASAPSQKVLLPLLSGFPYGLATQINNNGLIGGLMYNSQTGVNHAAIWAQQVAYDLNAITQGLGNCTLYSVSKITNDGLISASGMTPNFAQCNVMLEP